VKKIIVLLTLLASPHVQVMAHHSFAAEFDANTTISVTGVITEVRYRNPHVQYFIDARDGDQAGLWNVQAQNVPSLRRRGWSRDTLKLGDQITVNGFAGRDGAKKVYVASIVAPGGELLTMFDDDGVTGSAVAATEAVSIGDSRIAAQLIGHWGFDVDLPLPGAPFHLEFLQDGDKVSAVLDNEELDVTVGEDSFTMILERENFGGFPAKMQLKGSIVNDSIKGTVDLIAGYSSVPALNAKSFTAVRSSPEQWDYSTPKAMQPVDLTGTWSRVISLGAIGRTNPMLSAAGKSRHAEYQKGLYDPTLRCMSTGIMRRYAAPGLIEILADTNRLTILYVSGSEIRRIWFDQEQHNLERRHDVMGESLGSWDGSTLVIDTRNLTETVLTHNAEPISVDAKIVERYWLEENGELVMEATLYDPTYYDRPVVRRTQWKRADGQEMLYSPCDPDSFYRSMQTEGTLDAYYENQPGGDQ
jgi:hypothetical protein